MIRFALACLFACGLASAQSVTWSPVPANFPLTIVSPTNGQCLTYNGTTWVNSACGTASSVPASGVQAGTLGSGVLLSALGQLPTQSPGTVISNCTAIQATPQACFLGYSNVMWQGAYADGQQSSFVVTASTSSNTITVTGGSFTGNDVGKVIVITGIGATQSTGVVTSAPVTTAGSYVGAMPTLTASGSGTNAILYPNMQATNAALISGGAGCTTGTQTFTLAGTALGDTATQFTGVVSGGALTGSLTLTVAGSYSIGVPPAAAVANGGGCTTQPSVTLTYSVASVRVTGSGLGWTSGSTTIAVSGGSPTTAAVIGTPVVTATVLPLTTTISTVNSSTSITVAATPGTAVSASTQTVFWGHDDLPAIQAALNTLEVAYLPNTSGVKTTYWVSAPIVMNTQNVLLGTDRDMVTVKAMPGINNHLVETPNFNTTYTGSSSGTASIRIENITLDGNGSVQFCSNPDLCNVVSLYGTYFTVRNVALNNSAGNGMRTVFNAGNSAPDGANLESNFHSIWITNSQHHGWWNSGPHDCSAKDLIIISSSQGGDNTWDGLYNDNYAACRYDNIHPYSGSQSNFPKFQFSSAGSNQVENSTFEGGRSEYEARASYDTVEHTQFYNNYGGYGSALVVLEANENHITGNFQDQANAADYAVQIGTAGASVTNNFVDILTQGFIFGGINYLNDTGNFTRTYGGGNASPNSTAAEAPYGGIISGSTTNEACIYGNAFVCSAIFPQQEGISATGSNYGWQIFTRNHVRRWGWALDSSDNIELVDFSNSGLFNYTLFSANRITNAVSIGLNGTAGAPVTTAAASIDGSAVSQVLTSTYTVPVNTDLVRFTQTGTLAASTITLPTAFGDSQYLQFDEYSGTVTALTFSPSVNGWTNGATFYPYSVLRIRWDNASSAWIMEAPNPGGPIISGGARFSVASGTGACATSANLGGRSQAGQLQCTGTAGTSTVTLTLPTLETFGAYSCWGRDITNPTTLTQTGAVSTSSVTLTMTQVYANDYLQFGCVAY